MVEKYSDADFESLLTKYDYKFKKGDIISNYEVIDIDRTTVTVKLGNNTYKAGIGEVLTSNNLHHNKVSNLDKKFGGKNGN